MNNGSLSYHVVVVGTGAVGKSSLTLRFSHNKFPEKYDPTIEDSYSQTVTIDDKECVLNILDTAGQEEFHTLRDEYLRDGEAFLMVYSVIQMSSLDGLRSINSAIVRAKGNRPVPRMMVGNKIDLEDERTVTIEEAQKVAKEFGDIPLTETSALTGKNVRNIFEDMVRIINKFREQNAKSNGQSERRFKFCTLL